VARCRQPQAAQATAQAQCAEKRRAARRVYARWKAAPRRAARSPRFCGFGAPEARDDVCAMPAACRAQRRGAARCFAARREARSAGALCLLTSPSRPAAVRRLAGREGNESTRSRHRDTARYARLAACCLASPRHLMSAARFFHARRLHAAAGDRCRWQPRRCAWGAQNGASASFTGNEPVSSCRVRRR